MGGVFQFFPVIGTQSKQQFHQCIKMRMFPLCIQTQIEQKIYIYTYINGLEMKFCNFINHIHLS